MIFHCLSPSIQVARLSVWLTRQEPRSPAVNYSSGDGILTLGLTEVKALQSVHGTFVPHGCRPGRRHRHAVGGIARPAEPFAPHGQIGSEQGADHDERL